MSQGELNELLRKETEKRGNEAVEGGERQKTEKVQPQEGLPRRQSSSDWGVMKFDEFVQFVDGENVEDDEMG